MKAFPASAQGVFHVSHQLSTLERDAELLPAEQVGVRSPAMQGDSCRQKCVRTCFISSRASTVGGEGLEGEGGKQHGGGDN